MRAIITKAVIILVLACSWPAGMVRADVVIKVRALNPLDTKETAVINYPLPKEISKENIISQKITYSLDHSEDEEPPKAFFQVSFDESEAGYYIDDEVLLLPKEVVTLEVHVQDVWVIDKAQIEEMRNEVDGLLKKWEEESPPAGTEEEKSGEEETKEFALTMKKAILESLDKIIERQDKNKIIDVGVERHIAAHGEIMDEFRQIQQDIVLLANLIQFDAGGNEGDGLEGGEAPEPGMEKPGDPSVSNGNETVGDEQKIEL